MKINPSSAHASRNSPFSVTLAWVQVRPDKYQTTGSFAPSWCGGTKTEKVMLVPVSRLACLETPWTPSNHRFVETVSSVMAKELQRRRPRDHRAPLTIARRVTYTTRAKDSVVLSSGLGFRFCHMGGDRVPKRRCQAIIGFEPELPKARTD